MVLLLWGPVPWPGAGCCPAALPTPSGVQPLLPYCPSLPSRSHLLPNLTPGLPFLPTTGCPQALGTSVVRSCCLFDKETQMGAEGRGRRWDLAQGCPYRSKSDCLADAEGTVGQEQRTHSSGTEIPVPPPTPGPHVQSLVGISFPLPRPWYMTSHHPHPHLSLLPVCAVLSQAVCHRRGSSLCLPTLACPGDSLPRMTKNKVTEVTTPTPLCWPKGTCPTLQCPPSSHCYGNSLPGSRYGKMGFLLLAGAASPEPTC